MAPYFKKKEFSLANLFRSPAKSNEYLDFLKSKLTPELRDKVTFHGFVSRPDLVRLYYDADLFVFPPIWNEAFGVTPLEAMAAGVPVAVSRCGGILETVQDEKTGFIVDPGDAAALAQVMLRLLDDDTLREKMGRAGRQRALEFRWEIVNGRMLARYRALVQASSAERESSQKNLVSAG